MSKADEKQEEFWFTLVRSGDFRKLWKPQLEILFLLKGMGNIYFPKLHKILRNLLLCQNFNPQYGVRPVPM